MEFKHLSKLVNDYCGLELHIVSARSSSIGNVAYLIRSSQREELNELFDIRPLNGAFIYGMMSKIDYLPVVWGDDIYEILKRLDEKMGKYIPYWLTEEQRNKKTRAISDVYSELLEEIDSLLDSSYYQSDIPVDHYQGNLKPYVDEVEKYFDEELEKLKPKILPPNQRKELIEKFTNFEEVLGNENCIVKRWFDPELNKNGVFVRVEKRMDKWLVGECNNLYSEGVLTFDNKRDAIFHFITTINSIDFK